MKVKNFPGRKNSRRIKRLDELNSISGREFSANEKNEVEVLHKKIMNQEDAEKVLTKKRRSK
jgi:hypothetical protein